MLSRFAKLVLTATSLAPVLCAFGIAQLEGGKSIGETYGWFVLCVGLVVLAVLVMWFARTQLQVQHLQIKKVKGADREILAFMLAYLLPLIAQDALDVSKHIYSVAFVFLAILITVYHSNSFDFNPLLGIIGYHFYEVELADGMAYLLITRHPVRKQELRPEVVQLSETIFLEWGRKKR